MQLSRITIQLVVVLLVVSSVLPTTAYAQEEPEICDDGPPIRGLTGNDTTEQVELEIVLLNDNSGSMSTEVSSGTTRLDVLKDAVGKFIDQVNTNNELGHTTTSNDFIKENLTKDHVKVNNSVQNLVASGNSFQDDGRGMNFTSDVILNNTNATDGTSKVVLYSSDGDPRNETRAREVAQRLRDSGVTIFTIGIGSSADGSYLTDIAGSADRYYDSPDGSDLESIYDSISTEVKDLNSASDLRIKTRQLYQPGETHDYTVILRDNSTGTVQRSDVTSEANLTVNSSYSGDLLTVNKADATMTSVNDENVSNWARVNATADGVSGCTNVIVSTPKLENLELLPGIWRLYAIFSNSAIFALMIAGILSVPASRYTSSFGGLAVAEMVVVIGWFAGYVGTGIATLSVFVAIFIGLNLAQQTEFVGGGAFARK